LCFLKEPDRFRIFGTGPYLTVSGTNLVNFNMELCDSDILMVVCDEREKFSADDLIDVLVGTHHGKIRRWILSDYFRWSTFT
jgi:hypothetical protein